MVHRLALTFGGLGAVGVVALALALGGSPFPSTGSVNAAGQDAGVAQLVEPTAGPTDDASSTVETVVDVVYVEAPIGNQASNGTGPGSDGAPASPDPTASSDATVAPDSGAVNLDEDWDDDDLDDTDDDSLDDDSNRGRDHREDD